MLLSPQQIALSLLVSLGVGRGERVLAVHPGAGLELHDPLLADQPLHLPPGVLHLGQLLRHVLGDVGDGGGDDELEEQHDVLQGDDEENCLGSRHVGEDPVNWPRQSWRESLTVIITADSFTY